MRTGKMQGKIGKKAGFSGMGQESEAGGRQEDSWPREGGVWRELSRNTGNTPMRD